MFKGAFHVVLIGSTVAGGLVCETLLELSSAFATVPFIVRVVTVECNGNCADNSLGQLCAQAGSGLVPIAVDCKDVADHPPGFVCAAPGLNTNNRCFVQPLSPNARLSEFCSDTSGWDAQVYCAQ